MLNYRFETCDQSWSDWSGCNNGTEIRYRLACPDIIETKVCEEKCGKTYFKNTLRYLKMMDFRFDLH